MKSQQKGDAILFVKREVLTAISSKKLIFWNVTPSSLVYRSRSQLPLKFWYQITRRHIPQDPNRERLRHVLFASLCYNFTPVQHLPSDIL